MKALRKLLAGTILVALAAFGLTTLTSSSTNSVVPVIAFLNTTCNSALYMEHESIQDMLEFKGTERDGIVWDFKSYHHIADQSESDPRCYLVSAIGEVVARGTQWPARPSDPYGAQGGEEGGSGGGGGEEGGSGGHGPSTVFNDDDLTELNNKWQGCADNIESEYGDYELEYREQTDYTWATDQRDDNPGEFGETKHKPHYTVTIFPVNIATNEWGIEREHMTAQAVLMEYIHTIQEPFNILTDNKFDREVVSYNLSNYWYRAIWNKNPPFKRWSKTQIVSAKRDSWYVTEWKEIKELQKKAADEDGLEAADYNRLVELQDSISTRTPEYKPSNNYDTGSLECD